VTNKIIVISVYPLMRLDERLHVKHIGSIGKRRLLAKAFLPEVVMSLAIMVNIS